MTLGWRRRGGWLSFIVLNGHNSVEAIHELRDAVIFTYLVFKKVVARRARAPKTLGVLEMGQVIGLVACPMYVHCGAAPLKACERERNVTGQNPCGRPSWRACTLVEKSPKSQRSSGFSLLCERQRAALFAVTAGAVPPRDRSCYRSSRRAA